MAYKANRNEKISLSDRKNSATSHGDLFTLTSNVANILVHIQVQLWLESKISNLSQLLVGKEFGMI